MLNRPLPLKSPEDFKLVFKQGRHIGSGFFRIALKPNKLGVLRLGIVTGQKLNKSAVVRNRLRRRIREAFRHHMPAIDKRFDIIVLPNPSAIAATHEALIRELLTDLKRARVFS